MEEEIVNKQIVNKNRVVNNIAPKKWGTYSSAYTLIGLLWFIVMISFSIIVFNRWQQSYLLQSQRLYTQTMALQIAQNQQALRLKKYPCQAQVTQNKIVFKIQCSSSYIKVSSGDIQITIQ